MSSPAPSNAGDRVKKQSEQISFKFCSECSNMLYPKEDEADHKLLFTCRTCSYSEEATSSCIYRNILNNAAGETAGVTQDVGSDPTVGASYVDPDAMPSHFRYCMCTVCGVPISCNVCGINYAIVPAQDDSEPEREDDSIGLEEIDARPWDVEEGLSEIMARADGYLVEFMDEDEDESTDPGFIDDDSAEQLSQQVQNTLVLQPRMAC